MADYDLKPGQTLRIFSENKTVNWHTVVAEKGLGGNSLLTDPLFISTNNLRIGDILTDAGKSMKFLGIRFFPIIFIMVIGYLMGIPILLASVSALSQ